MNSRAKEEEINRVLEYLEKQGFSSYLFRDGERTIVGAVDDRTRTYEPGIETLPGVERVVPVLEPYKMVSRNFKPEDTVIRVRDVEIGGKAIQVMAGPCAVESREQILEAAHLVKAAGARFLRGGAFKPRSSPYSFQGLEEKGLKYLAEAGEATGLPIVTEVMDTKALPVVAHYADILQIGARNMQNFCLLREVAAVDMPVLLKRGFSATIEEWLLSAEYIVAGGNPRVILCERGIRSFETYMRNTLDLSSVPAVKHLSHLPVIVDPSHGTGRWRLVAPMARAALAAGADGLMIEVHPRPEEALSDGSQSLKPDNFKDLMEDLRRLAVFLHREI